MPIDIPEFKPGTSAPEEEGDFPTGGLSLTDAGTRATAGGLRSPDAIDRPGVPRVGNVLAITTDQNVQALPPEVMAALQAQLHRAGLMPSTYRPTGQLDEETKKALMQLKAQASSAGMSDMTALRSAIETRAQAAAGAYDAGPAGGSSGGVAVSQKRTEVRTDTTEPILTDAKTARAVLRQTLADRLGRAPDADEYHQFRTLLSNSESGQDVSTTTSKYGRSGRLKSTRTTNSDDTTDPSADVLADEFSRKGRLGREANTHMVATDYYDVVQSLVGG